ncbi:MAG: class I SAM-dependent methyltransferase [Chloroflexota bacterium]|nr:class I SAM-dependent methyltransferase [Chloroflexota bacterium]
MSASVLYDEIGRGYARERRSDPRIAARLRTALGDARSVLNVGAGAGSYEPDDRTVVAVEPSAVMIAQRPPGSAPVVRAAAEALPFADRAFDAVLAVLTLHHWVDRAGGLAECARVARERVVLLTWDAASDGFWLVQEYFPEFVEIDRQRFPAMEAYGGMFGPGARVEVSVVPIPRDCVDGFLGAYWARPAAYLDAQVRAGISSFARPGAEQGLGRLASDLVSGAWHERHGHLLKLDELDLGYRLVVAHLLDAQWPNQCAASDRGPGIFLPQN